MTSGNVITKNNTVRFSGDTAYSKNCLNLKQFKLFKHHTNHCTRSSFFCERIINVRNSLPSTVNFSSLNCFKQSIGSVDLSVFLKCS